MRILLEGEKSEAVLDLLETKYAGQEGYRVVILPVEATLPRVELAEEAAPAEPLSEEKPPEEKPPERISRHELYEDISDAARFSRVYFAMVVLSAIVATIGLDHNSVAIVIGAMVIAPLLGPNMALATTLGDLPLARRAVLTGLAGIATVAVMTAILGALLHVDQHCPNCHRARRLGSVMSHWRWRQVAQGLSRSRLVCRRRWSG